MANKKTGIPCYDKASADEPLFVLRAQDVTAPETVRHWARNAQTRGVNMSKVSEAFQCANDMEDWQNRNLAIVKAPD
jgi:hypothetical protein